MKAIDGDELTLLLRQTHINPKFYKDVRFKLPPTDKWEELEFIALPDRVGAKGIFLTEIRGAFFITSYELMHRVTDKQTGRSKSVICDFCYTRQMGANAARITFTRQSDQHNLTFLCCGDLACSQHVRDKTPAAALSRVHIHEDLTVERRTKRLSNKIAKLVHETRGYCNRAMALASRLGIPAQKTCVLDTDSHYFTKQVGSGDYEFAHRP